MKSQLFNSLFQLEGVGIVALEDSILMMDNPIRDKFYAFPFTFDCVCCIIVKKGGIDCSIDTRPMSIRNSGLLIILERQIIENISFTADFQGAVVLFSKQFLNSLDLSDAFKKQITIRESPFSVLDNEALGALMNYVAMIRGIIQIEMHPYRTEIVRLLTKAFYLGLGYYIHEEGETANKRMNTIFSQFINLVRENCCKYRELSFYADQLCISCKYLYAVVRQISGKAPSKWIEDYTLLNAKQLLSTSMCTVGQISELLNFKSQSDFGKYFKKATGMSPVSFRESL